GCQPGREWLTLTKRAIPSGEPWTTLTQETAPSSLIALPGGNNLGLGRHWHFVAAMFWVINGLIYMALLFASGETRRLLPTSPQVFVDAAGVAWRYLTLRHPAENGETYNALQ